MTAASASRLARRARSVGAGPPDRVLLLEHLRHALLEAKSDPSLCVAFLLLRVKAGVSEAERPGAMARLQEQLRAAVRSRPWRGRRDLVAWLGGGEFAILTAPLNEVRDAERIAQRLLELAARSLQEEGEALVPRLAIGIAAVHGRYRRPEELLAAARRALEEAEQAFAGWRVKT